jgi:hypothetical protein
LHREYRGRSDEETLKQAAEHASRARPDLGTDAKMERELKSHIVTV